MTRELAFRHTLKHCDECITGKTNNVSSIVVDDVDDEPKVGANMVGEFVDSRAPFLCQFLCQLCEA